MFSFLEGKSAILLTVAAIITQTKPYEISAMSTHSVVKLDFIRLYVCLPNGPSQWRRMTSHNVTLIDVIGTLYHFALEQNRNAVFIWSVDVCFIFIEQINVIFRRPLYEAVSLCHCIINLKYC